MSSAEISLRTVEGLRLAGDARVEARVLDGLRDARCGEGEQVQVLGLKKSGCFALEIHDADEAVFGDERNGEFGADVGVGGDVVFDCGDVVEQHGLTCERDLADDAFAERKAHAFGFGRVADLEAHAEVLRAVVEQEDGKDAVGNDGANELGGAIEEGLQVERGVERVGDLGEVTRGRWFRRGRSADRYGRAGCRSRRGDSRLRTQAPGA